jgi:hypothetical protein
LTSRFGALLPLAMMITGVDNFETRQRRYVDCPGLRNSRP